MAVDPRRRQKKLERRKAGQKAERRGAGGRTRLACDASGGVNCSHSALLRGATLWREGIGQLVLSRQMSDGMVAFGAFLVDRYCLGVKDAFANVSTHERYRAHLYDKLAGQDTLVELKPECARKLIEGAVRYAEDLGIPPHSDYYTAKLILGDIQAEACAEEFEFGKDGKPFFIGGPHDSPARC